MKIKVTQEHIDKGERSLCAFCPVALAFKDVFPDKKVQAGIGVAIIEDAKYLLAEYWDLPREASNFIEQFDRGFPVYPFEFDAVKRAC